MDSLLQQYPSSNVQDLIRLQGLLSQATRVRQPQPQSTSTNVAPGSLEADLARSFQNRQIIQDAVSRARMLTGLGTSLPQAAPMSGPEQVQPQAQQSTQVPSDSVETMFSDALRQNTAKKQADAASLAEVLNRPATDYKAQHFASSPLPASVGVSQQQINQLLAAASRNPLPTFGPDSMITGWQNPNAAIAAQMLGIGLNAANDNLGIRSQYQTADMDRQAQFAGMQNRDATSALIDGQRLMQQDTQFDRAQTLAEAMGLTESAYRGDQAYAQSDLARAQAEAMRSSTLSPVEQALNALQLQRAQDDPIYADQFEEQLKSRLSPQGANAAVPDTLPSKAAQAPTMRDLSFDFERSRPTVEAIFGDEAHDLPPAKLLNSLIRSKRQYANKDLQAVSRFLRAKYHMREDFRVPKSIIEPFDGRADKMLNDIVSGRDLTQSTIDELRKLEQQRNAEIDRASNSFGDALSFAP